MPGPAVEYVDTHATLAAKGDECPFTFDVVVVEGVNGASTPPKSMCFTPTTDASLERRVLTEGLVHQRSLTHGRLESVTTARMVSAVGMRRSSVAAGSRRGQ